jgi:uncharacterized protein YPO0396
MKILKKLLLIHWHYFVHETIEFDFINFLTGKNASGKSTIIDALQLVLLADTAGNSFNKAASGKNSRTLKGYILGELGDDEDSGFRYLRTGNFTSYVALEFFDDEKNASFTAGCCFDVYSESDYPKLFFCFNGKIPENEFIDDSLAGHHAMNIAALRSWLRSNYKEGAYSTTERNGTFQEELYGKLGALQSRRFTQLFKRAVSFNPNVDIQKFISEFICDTPQMVDVSSLQDNIRSYTHLKEEIERLRQKIEEMERIAAAYAGFDAQRKNEILYSYLITKAERDMKYAAIQDQEAEAARLLETLKRLAALIDESKKTIEKMREEREELRDRLANNEAMRLVDLLEKQIRDRNNQILDIKKEFDVSSRPFINRISQWKTAAAALEKERARLNMDAVDPILSPRINSLCEEASRFAAALEDFRPDDPKMLAAIGENGVKSRVRAADSLRVNASMLIARLSDEKKALEEKRRNLEDEERSLKSGIFQFPPEVRDLKEAIAGRLRLKSGGPGEVFIVAETAEIPEDRWRNVIEGYLHTQKFNLIVRPEHFSIALNVYDSIKKKRAIYNTGLVDIEKIERLSPQAEAGSLAEEIKTENHWVRLFLDYTLGRVMKCNKLSELRNHRSSVTDEGMLYQNYTARAMNPARWARPAIGQDAIRLRIIAVRQELNRLDDTLAALETVHKAVIPLAAFDIPGDSEAERLLEAAAAMERIPLIMEDIAGLEHDLAAVDRSEIDVARKRIASLENAIEKTSLELDAANREEGKDEGRLAHIREKTIPEYKRDLETIENAIDESYPAEWIETTGGPRYQTELADRASPEKIYEAFPRELSRSKNAKEKFWDELKELRRIYNSRYNMGYDTAAEDNKAWENAYHELRENDLPKYNAKIEDAHNKAQEQFREDFLSRLQENINNAKRQIAGLNNALSSSSFGDDRYKFLIIPKTEYKHYYDMIVDPMLLLEGGYDLLSEQFNAKYHSEIEGLFAAITTGIDAGQAESRDDYERRVQTFTDYRTYLSFDLEVTNSEGESQRLSRTMAKKSGGETQTPFYIAVLASFTQLYRIGRDKKAGTVRLIVFDEAFSKMDSERISSSIELLRTFNFQVILSAPSDKIGDITPLADRSLLVFRDKKRSSVLSFDKTRLDAELNTESVETAENGADNAG